MSIESVTNRYHAFMDTHATCVIDRFKVVGWMPGTWGKKGLVKLID